MSLSRVRRFTYNFLLPTGSIAGQYTKRFQLDASFKRAFGYLVFENVNAGTGIIYQLGIKDDSQIYQDLTNIKDYQADSNVAKKDRYTKCDIQAGNNYITATVAPLATTTADLNLDIVFLLTNDDDTQELTPSEAAFINLLRKNYAGAIAAAEEAKKNGGKSCGKGMGEIEE